MGSPSFHIDQLDLGEDSASRAFSAKIMRLKSTEPGPRALMIASVHGAEVQGNAVIWELLNQLSTLPFCGEFIFIPLANPRATSTKIGTMTLGRFNPVTGDNWNRLYIDLAQDLQVEQFVRDHSTLNEAQLNQQYKIWLKQKVQRLQSDRSIYGVNENGRLHLKLQEIAVECDFILDLHTGPCATEYLYAPEYAKLLARDLPFAHQLIVPHVFAGAFDEASFMPWVILNQQMQKLGRQYTIPVEAYTVELGSEEYISSNLAKSQAAKILYFFSKRAMIQRTLPDPKVALFQSELKHYKTYYSPQGGLVEYLIKPGEHFHKGDCLARILNFSKLEQLQELPSCWTPLHAIEAGICINHYPSAIVAQGHELFQVMEQPQAIIE